MMLFLWNPQWGIHWMPNISWLNLNESRWSILLQWFRSCWSYFRVALEVVLVVPEWFALITFIFSRLVQNHNLTSCLICRLWSLQIEGHRRTICETLSVHNHWGTFFLWKKSSRWPEELRLPFLKRLTIVQPRHRVSTGPVRLLTHKLW